MLARNGARLACEAASLSLARITAKGRSPVLRFLLTALRSPLGPSDGIAEITRSEPTNEA